MSLAAKAFQTSLPLCKETFFSKEIDDHLVLRFVPLRPVEFTCQSLTVQDTFHCKIDVIKDNIKETLMTSSYQELMTESSRMPLFDLKKLNASLPVAMVANPSTHVLVMGAANDFIVDAKGLEETGSFYGVQPVCVEGVAHDMMLDSSWEKGANLILSWIKSLENI